MKKLIENGVFGLLGIVFMLPAMVLFLLGTMGLMERFNPFIIVLVALGLLFMSLSVILEKVVLK